MTNVEGEEVDDFIATGRVGRRNALPDILNDKHAATSTADLPDTLSKLTCSGRMSASSFVIERNNAFSLNNYFSRIGQIFKAFYCAPYVYFVM